jgi:hypothetical protein
MNLLTIKMTKWDEIFNSLDEESVCRGDKVSLRNLTSYLDDLYDKIAELEKRLDKQDEYQQEQRER